VVPRLHRELYSVITVERLRDHLILALIAGLSS